jgi:predicted MPP superfamily phosphohydrolase
MAALPGAVGLVSAKKPPTMPIVRLCFPDLHRDLEGLKILHLSDLHLGAYFGLSDLARALDLAKEKHRPDLIVLTGDLADDPSLIPEALRLVTAANARYGAIASLGNHEYLHGIDVTRPKYEASPVPLLVGTGRALRIGKATLFIGGSDDPVHMHGDIAWLVSGSIERSMRHAPRSADFKLLLCHRPEGHGPAAEVGYDLTLSGHTHGGQVGLLGRSLFEKLRPGIGWWGAYLKKKKDGRPSRLYTTSGFGHWLPFRFGCPTEMPLVVLEGSPSGHTDTV